MMTLRLPSGCSSAIWKVSSYSPVPAFMAVEIGPAATVLMASDAGAELAAVEPRRRDRDRAAARGRSGMSGSVDPAIVAAALAAMIPFRTACGRAGNRPHQRAARHGLAIQVQETLRRVRTPHVEQGRTERNSSIPVYLP